MARRKTAGTRSRYGRGGAGRGRTGGSQRGGRGMSARGGPGAMVGGVGGGFGGAPGFSGLSAAAEGRFHSPSFTIAPQFLPPGMSLEQSQQFDPYGVFGQGAGQGIPTPGMIGTMPAMTSGGGGFTASPLAQSTLTSPSFVDPRVSGGGGGYTGGTSYGGGGGGLASPTGPPAYGGGGGGTQYNYNAPGGGSLTYNPNYTGGGGPVLGSNTPKGGVYLPGLVPHSGDIGSPGGALPGMQYFGAGGTTIANAPYEANKPGGGAPHYNPNYGGGGGGGGTHQWGGARHPYGSWANNPNNPNYGLPHPGVGLQNNVNANPQYGQPGGGAPNYNPNYSNQQNQQNQNPNKKILGPYAGKTGL